MTGVRADQPMSNLDALVWNVEQQPRQRTTIAALARFAAPLDPAELRHRVDHASRVVGRLRQRVVTDPSGLTAPRWSVDPDFHLSFHLRTVRLADPADAELMDLVRGLLVQPFDRSRPLWEFTHVTGLAEALLLKTHHAVTDGVGGVELMLELFGLEPQPVAPSRPLPEAPVAPAASVISTAGRDAAGHETAVEAIRGLATVIDHVTRSRSVDDCASAGRRAGEAIGSVVRMLRPSHAPPVVAPARSGRLDIRFFSVPVDALRQAGRRHDGTINDAFVAAVALGLADQVGTEHRSRLRLSVPISTRPSSGDGDTGGGSNHWAPSLIEIDLRDAADLPTLMRRVRCEMRRVRRDPAHRLLPALTAGLRRLPPTAGAAVLDRVTTGIDVAVSNVPGSPVRLHLGPQPVDALIPFGPLSGCAVNVTLLSHADTAHIGVSSDPAVIDDPGELLRNLEAGFAVVTAVCRDDR
ncbi:MAG: wax ester/triacylglycerol synthase family O-acyltransferase [Acidimicrobiales bacterium]